jgi:hypothetical protein
VRTNIANAERNRPAELRNEPVMLTPAMQAGLATFKAAVEASMPPLQVADVIFDAIEKEQFYILPIPNGPKRSNSERTNCSKWKIRKALQQRLRNSSTSAGEGRIDMGFSPLHV